MLQTHQKWNTPPAHSATVTATETETETVKLEHYPCAAKNEHCKTFTPEAYLGYFLLPS